MTRTLDECVTKALQRIEDIRIQGVIDGVKPVVLEAAKRGCGTRLTLVGGWFQSCVVDPDTPINKMTIVER